MSLNQRWDNRNRDALGAQGNDGVVEGSWRVNAFVSQQQICPPCQLRSPQIFSDIYALEVGDLPQEVRDAFAESYFASPWGNPESPSFVYEGTNRRVVGFLGVTTRQMVFAGRSIRVWFGGNFVVHPDA